MSEREFPEAQGAWCEAALTPDDLLRGDFDERVERANAAWTPELAAAFTIEKVETLPGAMCETCERNITHEDRAAHEGHDTYEFHYGEQTDELAMFLAKHLPLEMESGQVLCMCGAPMLDGPAFYRVHVATVVRAFLAASHTDVRPEAIHAFDVDEQLHAPGTCDWCDKRSNDEEGIDLRAHPGASSEADALREVTEWAEGLRDVNATLVALAAEVIGTCVAMDASRPDGEQSRVLVNRVDTWRATLAAATERGRVGRELSSCGEFYLRGMAVCTLDEGHEGDHQARSADVVAYQWPRRVLAEYDAQPPKGET